MPHTIVLEGRVFGESPIPRDAITRSSWTAPAPHRWRKLGQNGERAGSGQKWWEMVRFSSVGCSSKEETPASRYFARVSGVGDLGFEPRLTESESEPTALQPNSEQQLTPSKSPGCSAGCSAQQNERGITDPNLARVVEAWPTLPDALRRAVLALIGTNG